jgi:hypothetical protein
MDPAAPCAVLGWEDKSVNFRQACFPSWWYANVTDKNGCCFPGAYGVSVLVSGFPGE